MNALGEALAALPNTTDGIAAFFRERGIRGPIRQPRGCPVAVYLRQKGFTNIYAGPMLITATAPNGEIQSEITPQHVAWFVSRFDMRHWPELIETGW